METKDRTQALNESNPWKGLNFYKEGEVLYGRDDEIQSLALYVINNIQTVLYGKSGIGKSSIINAGIFPIARREGLFPVPIRLKHDEDTSYIDQIKEAFKKSGIGIKEILPAINEQEESLWEYLHRHTFFDKESNEAVRPLVVLDQFEEFFTLQHNENKKKAFFSELADLLNEVTPNYIINHEAKTSKEKQPVPETSGFVLDLGQNVAEDKVEYVSDSLFNIVFTIREDFLSYLERYTKFIPVMKTNRYALLPLNEEQAKDVIMKPIPGLVDIDVARLIIQMVTGRTDFHLGDAPEIEVDAAVLSLYLSRLYIKKGDRESTITARLVDRSSRDIIKDFYEESVADLPPAEIEKIEDQLLTYDGRRNNVSRGDLINDGVSFSVIDTLVYDKKLLRQFSYQDDIRVEFMHDILCPIVNERIENRVEEKKKAEEQRRQEEQQRKLLAEEQRKREQIEAQAKADRERMEEEAREQKRKNKRRLTASFLLLFLGGLIWFSWYFFTSMKFTQYYASFTTKNGWPEGVGKKVRLSDRERMPVYYQLVRYGFFKNKHPNIRVNIMNRNMELVPNVFERSPMVGLYESEGEDMAAKEFAMMQQKTCYWEYTPDNTGNNLQRQTAFDKDGKEQYSIQYYHSKAQNDSETKQLWANYIDKDGKSLQIRDNGADRMRIAERNGRYVGYMFFSENGTPQCNLEGDYGISYELSDDGRIMKRQSLDEYGDTISNKSFLCYEFDDYGRWIKGRDARADYSANRIVNVIGKTIDTLLFDDNGHRIYHSRFDGNMLHTFTYNKEGNLIDNSIIEHDKKISSVSNRFDSDGNIVEKVSYSSTRGYLKETHEFEGTTQTEAYYGGEDMANMKPVNSSNNYHKKVIKKINDSCSIYSYYAIDSCGLEHLLRDETKTKNKAGQLVRHIVTDEKGNRTLSMEYEIDEKGVVVGEHVIGLDGDTIRNAKWDESHLCYYRMRFVWDFKGNLVAIKAINEFGEESMIIMENKKVVEIKASTIPANEIKLEGDTYDIYGIGSYKYFYTEVDKQRRVNYVHITDIEGSYYLSGIRDGDLLLSTRGNMLTVARPNKIEDSYIIINCQIQEGPTGAETYAVFFTTNEIERLNNAIIKNNNN